ncbi:putative Ig domain-containing protein [Streptomyces sp. MUM 16J]|uniref:putative Ig domain-containing protein n=1 Tax=Streptomyces sp. MUM 16J TaxID=2791988 RepID=UPI001F033EF6|nr:putative Ig domain-containing protein [Streptomyces sp. MUM 16J]MCH0557410.1 putative Ig domain-containing protein [Streptomyces sp. MUM 16J]
MGNTPRTSRARRWALTGAISLGTAAATLAAAPAAQARPVPPAARYHAHHHGVFPTVPQMAAARASSTASSTGQETLSYGGGVDGIGVQSGHSKVYLVFYGTQWGTKSTDSNGDATFSGDPDSAAPVAQEMFKDIGTGNERWSADLTQWCDGPNVSTGATSCPSNADFIPYQSGGVLSGVWYDNSAASPSSATGHQLAQEAINAAAHFGNTSASANRHAYYVILSPHGTDPDNYKDPNTGYCAWHDWNGDTTLNGGAASSPYGDIAFSNQPYNTDMGSTCGVGFVNGSSAGKLDGYTMTLGHEWQEMMSDQNPAGGWTNHVSGSSYNGQENADECAWIRPGQFGGAANVTMGTGTFAEQASWSNDTNECDISHAIVGQTSSNTVTVTNPGNQSGTVGTATSLQIQASDSDSSQTLTYAASGLPAGLSISSSTGRVSGTPTKSGTSSVTVTVTDGTGATGTTSFTWTENSTGGGSGGITNGGFETGSLSGWTTSGSASATGSAAHSGSYGASLGTSSPSNDSTAAQTFTAPSGSSQLSFSYSSTCPDTVYYDWATATLKDNTTGTTTTVLAKTCASSSAWHQVTAPVTAGHSYTLTLANHDDDYWGDATYTYYDDVTVS